MTDELVDRMREAIVSGVFALEERLSENALAARFGVSRTPIREALLRLEHERLVEVRPQRGTFVFTSSADEVREMCGLRAILECGALRLAASRSPKDLANLLTPAVSEAHEASRTSAAVYQPFDERFHRLIVTAAGNEELSACYARISGRIRALRFRLITTVEEVTRSQEEHAEIVAALAERNIDDAVDILDRHAHNSERALRRQLSIAGQAVSGCGSTRPGTQQMR